jgi:histidinol-phosphate aminotransferase
MIVDEAYVDFGAQSMVPMIGRYPNLLVIQTFSKSRALAGARVGFAMGQKDLIDYLNRVKNSFNSYTISRFSLEAARAAMLDTDYFSDITGRITATRERVKKELWAHGFDLTDSKTNFLWVRSDKIGGQELYEALKEQGILVRHFSDPAITDRIRVTIGTDQQMDVFLKTLFSITEKETTCVKQ